MRRMQRFRLLAIIAALFVSGCSASATEAGDPQTAARAINLKEYAIGEGDIRLTASEYPVKITVKNKGAIPHNLVIEQLGVDSGILAPGESAVVEIDPKAAKVLQAKCTLPGHAEAGMVAELTVGG